MGNPVVVSALIILVLAAIVYLRFKSERPILVLPEAQFGVKVVSLSVLVQTRTGN